MKNPSEEAIMAALDSLPYNDILYGDYSKPVTKEEMKKALEEAYHIDFPETISLPIIIFSE